MGIKRARELRRKATEAERRLWEAIRQLRESGYHFRRQAPIGPYFADFACHHARLIIELDGDYHGFDDQIDHDRRRDRFLGAAGYQVMRFANAEVFENIDGVALTIMNELADRPRLLRKARV